MPRGGIDGVEYRVKMGRGGRTSGKTMDQNTRRLEKSGEWTSSPRVAKWETSSFPNSPSASPMHGSGFRVDSVFARDLLCMAHGSLCCQRCGFLVGLLFVTVALLCCDLPLLPQTPCTWGPAPRLLRETRHDDYVIKRERGGGGEWRKELPDRVGERGVLFLSLCSVCVCYPLLHVQSVTADS